jgi:prepilin-type N-terminal cleavage/methylation domain-containing protein
MRQRGFTVMEVLIALAILAVGMVGILAMQKGTMSASGYSRRAVEAAVLGEDRLELLRTVPIATVASGNDYVDASGTAGVGAPYHRVWTVTTVGLLKKIVLVVSWTENDGTHALTFRTLRNTT